MSTKLGPNAPCECGSGKKYKHCCGMEGADHDNAPKKTLVRGIIGGVCGVALLLIVVANTNSTPKRSAPVPIKRTNSPTAPSTSSGTVVAGAIWSAEHKHWHQPPGGAPVGKVWSEEHGHWHGGPSAASTEQQRPQFQPGPPPPGPAPAGKEWNVEHGHWHDADSPEAEPASSSIPRVTAPQDPPAAPSESDEN
jgi:hypothetical protein